MSTLLCAENEARLDLTNAFLTWYAKQPDLQMDAIQKCQDWFAACGNIELN